MQFLKRIYLDSVDWFYRDNQEMSKGKTYIQDVVGVINEYVRIHGSSDVMKKAEIESLLKEKGILNETRVQVSDLCYNRSNVANFSSFESDIHLFEHLEKGYYRILGENYPYSGLILWLKKEDRIERIIGEWYCGKLIAWKPNERMSVDAYESEAKSFLDKLEEVVDNPDLVGEERESLVKIRINQSIFRDRLIKRYGKCCLCGVSDERLLVASHIKPWKYSSAQEKIDVDNGLLLCPNHDKLFDLGLITFDEDGRVILSSSIESVDRLYMNVSDDMNIKISSENNKYMSFHRERIFQK